jgi:uncharacterized protein YdaU (DUF1376 family)
VNGLPYYKAYPRDFIEGTIGMSFELKGAYRLVLDLIYMQNGRLPDDARYISGQLGCTVRAWNGYRAKLIELGKLKAEDGIISNFRANLELDNLREISRKNAENASLPRKNKDLWLAVAKRTFSHTEPDTEREYSDANASGGEPPPKASEPVDFTKEVFDRGVAFLGKYGTPERQARSLIGKWRKDAGDSETFNALRDANREGVTEPVGWITARLTKIRAGPRDADLSAVFAKIQGEMQ